MKNARCRHLATGKFCEFREPLKWDNAANLSRQFWLFFRNKNQDCHGTV
jgi:hypothetical protein